MDFYRAREPLARRVFQHSQVSKEAILHQQSEALKHCVWHGNRQAYVPIGVFAPKIWERLKIAAKNRILNFSFKGTIWGFLEPYNFIMRVFCQKLAIVGMQPLLWPLFWHSMLDLCRYALEQEKLRQKLTSKSDFLARRGAAWLLIDWEWRSRPSRLVFSIADSCCWAWGTSV